MECSIRDFILSAYIEDLSLCDDIIHFYNNSLNKKPGKIYDSTGIGVINSSVKESTDVSFEKNNPLWKKYVFQMQNLVLKYVEHFEWANNTSTKWSILENANIQHYKPNEGFKEWHFERSGGDLPIVHRFLVFMTYLNDVNDQGETEFYYQGYKVKPRKGLSLIWPSEWTHTHRGIPSPTQDKFIVTGWYSLFSST
jgi:hypothetical protein